MEAGRHAPGPRAPVIRVLPTAYAELRRHGEERYPQECCGVLLGRASGADRTATLALRCANQERDRPERRYAIDPQELLGAARLARWRGEEIVGFYHSHPDHPARPSPADLDEAHWLGCSYVVTRVDAGRAQATRSFLLAGSGEEDKRFQEEPVEQAPPPPAGGDGLPASPGGAEG